jgi:hypothetical protein
LAETVALTSPAASRTSLYSGSSTRWNRMEPQMMIGTGRKASRVSCQDVAANTAPTKITVQKVCRMTRAPTSRNRSSWLMSSLITLSTRPGADPSCQDTSSCCTLAYVSTRRSCSTDWDSPRQSLAAR